MAVVLYGKRKRSYSPRASSLAVARPYKRPLVRRNASLSPLAGRVRISGNYGRYPPFGGETKFIDADIDVDPIPSGVGSITDSVNKIVQGVTEVQRVGRKCTITSIHWRIRLALTQVSQAAAISGGGSARIILYLDKQCNGAAVSSPNQILEFNDYQSFRNLANSNRFVILCDKMHTLNYSNLGVDSIDRFYATGTIKEISFNKKLHIPVEFSGVTGAITEIRSNNIGILLVSSAARVRFFSKIRVRFTDN